jgi:hypothetical protein
VIFSQVATAPFDVNVSAPSSCGLLDQFCVQVTVRSNQPTLERVRANIVCNDAFLLTGPTLTILEVRFTPLQVSGCYAVRRSHLMVEIDRMVFIFPCCKITDPAAGNGTAERVAGGDEVRHRRAAGRGASVGPRAEQLGLPVRGRTERRARAEGLCLPALTPVLCRSAVSL